LANFGPEVGDEEERFLQQRHLMLLRESQVENFESVVALTGTVISDPNQTFLTTGTSEEEKGSALLLICQCC
jgi:hypothetical protein